MIWLTLLPFALWDSCRWAMVPLAIVISFLLLGIEEIGGAWMGCLGVWGVGGQRCARVPAAPAGQHAPRSIIQAGLQPARPPAVAIEEPFSILPLEQLW